MDLKRILLLVFMAGSFALKSQSVIQGLPLIKNPTRDTTVVVFHSASFSVYERQYQATALFVTWKHSSQRFQISGRANSSFEHTTFHFDFSDGDSSLFQLNADSNLIVYTPALIDTFSISGMQFTGGVYTVNTGLNQVTSETKLTYDVNMGKEYIYGYVGVTLDGNFSTGSLGTLDNPGITLQSNALENIVLSVLSPLVVKNLTSADDQEIILKRSAGDPENTFYGHGSWWIRVHLSAQRASLGTSSKPGIVIKNGKVDSISMTVAGGGFIFYALPIMDDFTLTYSHSKNQYAIEGLFTIGLPLSGFVKGLGGPSIPSFQIDAGDDAHPGFLFDPQTGTVTVEDAVFTFKRIKISSSAETLFEINDLSLRVKNQLPDSIYFRITIPPKMSLQAGLSFSIHPERKPGEQFVPRSILMVWEAKTQAASIPIGTTGHFIVKLGWEIADLNKAIEDWVVTGTTGITLGKTFQFEAGKKIANIFKLLGAQSPFKEDLMAEMAFVYVDAYATISRHGITLDVSGDLYAYFSSGQWTGTLGSIDYLVDIQFGHSYNFDLAFYILSPPNEFVSSTMGVHLSQSGDLEGVGGVKLTVPEFIPIIGGKKLASAQGAIRHQFHSSKNNSSSQAGAMPDQSYAAAWTKIKIPFDHINIGIKANLKDFSISKIGAGEEKAIQSEITSDTSQHPVSDNTELSEWHNCEMAHTFIIEGDKPAAYLQNELILDKRVFADPYPLRPDTYIAPVSANIEPSSGSNDLKSMLPDDSSGIYTNHGQTTRPYHAVIIDLSKSPTVPNHRDTIRWITVNHLVGSYSSIDWKHQPNLLLTPGEQVLTVSGYCNSYNTSIPLSENNIQLKVSPVFPRPEISFSVNPNTHALNIDYSAYLTDSTVVSVYWNLRPEYGGKIIAHLPYHQGTRIGDSTYRWVIQDWDPGILPQQKIYLYAVIDDFVNVPEYSSLDSASFIQNIAVTVAGGTDSTQVLLIPADTSRSLVHGIFHSSEGPAGDGYGYYNVPLGTYNLHCTNNSPDLSLYTATVWNLDGRTEGTYLSEKTVSLNFTAVTWDNGITNIDFATIDERINLFGKVTDTTGQSVGEYTIYMLDHKDSLIQSPRISDLGYIFTNQDTGNVKLAVKLHEGNFFHWPRTSRRKYLSHDGLNGHFLVVDRIDIGAVSKGLDFKAIEGPQGPIFIATDIDNLPVQGVVFSLKKTDGTGPILHAISDQDGLAYLEADEVTVNTSYMVNVSWPEHYKADSPTSQHYQWFGTTDPFLVVARIK